MQKRYNLEQSLTATRPTSHS